MGSAAPPVRAARCPRRNGRTVRTAARHATSRRWRRAAFARTSDDDLPLVVGALGARVYLVPYGNHISSRGNQDSLGLALLYRDYVWLALKAGRKRCQYGWNGGGDACCVSPKGD